MYTTATKNKVRGDAMAVSRVTQARGLNHGKGYTWRYVNEVLNGSRKNDDISAIHAELIALRTPKHAKR